MGTVQQKREIIMKNITRKIALSIFVIVIALNMVACTGSKGYTLTTKCDGCGAQTAYSVAKCVSEAGSDFKAAGNCVTK